MKKFYILSVDQSTQGTKAMLLNSAGRLVLRRDVPHRQLVNDKGWVGHDAEEIAANIFKVTRRVVEDSGIDRRLLACIAVANQRESVAVWDRESSKPMCESIVWQCSRASQLCRRIQEQGLYPEIHRRTGLVPSPFFSAGKIAWVLENIPGVRERAERGKLCVGTMDSWTIWQLTCGKVHRTDYSNAGRTQLMNIHDMAWDPELCRIFRIPMSVLPEICDSDAVYGQTDLGGFLDSPIPIHCAVGDSNGALFGAGCCDTGNSMANHGTGTCVMMNIGDKPVLSSHGVNTMVAWRTGGRSVFALEGVVNYAGAVTTWMMKDLGLISTPGESEQLAWVANPGDRTYLVPAFTGIGAPYWRDDVSACFTGMTRLTGRAELVRAGLESIAYQVADIIQTFEEDAGVKASEVRMSGGPANNRYLMQFHSDILAVPTAVGHDEELVGIGAGQLAGLAMGLYDRAMLDANRKFEYFQPAMDEVVRREKLAGWQRAVRSVLNS